MIATDSSADERMWRETIGLGVLAALVYAMTWQGTLHGTDWRWFVLWLDEPGVVHQQHPGFLVVANALRVLLGWLDLDAYATLRVMSILGGALAVMGIHRIATALGGGARRARFAAALATVSPALWHHATVVELHAAFAGCMVWSLVFTAAWLRGGRARDVVLAGVCSGAAVLMHATGHLLVVMIAAAAVRYGRGAGCGSLVRRLSVFAGVHAATWGILFFTLRAVGNAPASTLGDVAGNDTLGSTDPFDYILRSLDTIDFAGQSGPTLLHEWVQPFAPWSVLLLVALVVGRHRLATVLLHLVLAVYLAFTMILVQGVTDERGAYLLPLVAPAVLLALELVSPRWWPVLFIAAVACGMAWRGEPGRAPPDRAFGRAAVTLAAARPVVFFVAGFPEMDGIHVIDAKLDPLVALERYDVFVAEQGREPTPVEAAASIVAAAVQARAQGAALVVTDRAIAWLASRVPGCGPLITARLPTLRASRLPAAAGIAGLVIE